MQIIIDISEELYNRIFVGEMALNSDDKWELEESVRLSILHGKVLPKGHGRLIDADEALKAMDTWDKFGFEHTGWFVRNPKDDFIKYVHYDDMVKSVRGADTIIEADKEAVNDSKRT